MVVAGLAFLRRCDVRDPLDFDEEMVRALLLAALRHGSAESI